MSLGFGRALAVVAVAAGVAGASAGSAHASQFDNVFAFGDSLNDTGNLAEIQGANFPNPPFFNDSVTNGPPAIDFVTQAVTGHAALPSLFETGFADIHNLFKGTVGLGTGVIGTNYAIAGALANNTQQGVPVNGPANQTAPTGHKLTGDLTDQVVNGFLARPSGGGVADPNALYFIQIGGNDIRNAAHKNDDSFVTNAVSAIAANIQTLINAGARSFLVPNAGNVGAIPEFSEQSPAAQAALATADSIQFNQLLAAAIQKLLAQNPGIKIDLFDFFDFSNQVAANFAQDPNHNVTDPCLNTKFMPNANCIKNNQIDFADFLFWDNIHPTAQIQAAWGQGEILSAVLPEPTTLASLGAGLLGLVMLRRRRAAR